MRITRRHVLAGPLLAALLTVGCAGESDTPELEVAGEQTSDDEQGGEGSAADGPDDAPRDAEQGEGPTDGTDDEPPPTEMRQADEGGGERAGAWPDPIPVDEVLRHEDGIVIEVFEIRAAGSAIEAEVRITNGYRNQTRLNSAGDATVLTDDVGNRYPLVPPEGDRQFSVSSGDVIEGSMSFVGPLAPDATELTMTVAPDAAGSDTFGPRPHMTSDAMPLRPTAGD